MKVPENFEAKHATIYRAAIACVGSELQLIWTRYTGFIVMNGFLVNVLSKQWELNSPQTIPNTAILASVGIIGLILNSVWHILNFSGWQNQNLFLYQAYKIFDQPVGLVTDQFDTIRLPYGWIYWTAQLMPTIFSIGASACFGIVLIYAWGYPLCTAVLSSLLLWFVFVGLVLIIEYRFIWSWSKRRQGAGEAV